MFRPGTRYVADTETHAERSRLLKFLFSTTQTYVIEAGNLYFRFYTDSGQLLSGGSPVDVTTVFTTANLDKIKYAQNADTMYICTGVDAVYKLQRTSATVFTMTKVAFVRGPFLDVNIDSADTLEPSADTGAGITVTAVGHTPFTSGHVDSLWRIKDGVVKTVVTSTGDPPLNSWPLSV